MYHFCVMTYFGSGLPRVHRKNQKLADYSILVYIEQLIIRNEKSGQSSMKYFVVFLVLVGTFYSIAIRSDEHGAERVYLSGAGASDTVDWQFKCSYGRKCGEWTTIPVPSNWEQQGFGNYNYGHDSPSEKHDEVGTYKTTFFAPVSWKDKHIRIVFEGVMTETTVYVNGEKLGTENLGGYVPFRHDLSKVKGLVRYGHQNELKVVVAKKPSNKSLDRAERKADYWVFGGIYRPVYIEVQNKSFINRVAIDAKADGSFSLDVFPQINYLSKFKVTPPALVDEVYAQIYNLSGDRVGKAMSKPMLHGSGRVRFNTKIKRPKVWSPEYPNLYTVKVELRKGGKTISKYDQRFGFRTFEVRQQDGFYLNGKKIMVKGVNRNVFHPVTGRAVNKEKVWQDARAIKAANINLVRSHLPPTTEFMEACDELGLLVIAELSNWHAPWIDTPIARNIAYELVSKYQNHPSVILWANGNEGGFNFEIDEIYHLLDLQNRPVIHPWTNFEEIETFHYPNYEQLLDKLKAPTVFMPTEFLHGLYDGGHGAGLEDYWAAMRSTPTSAGGVLWCWADAALSRTDKNGVLDTAENMSSDGMVGPYGEKEASYHAVRHIWSPIQIKETKLSEDFRGKLSIQNDYYDTNIRDCRFNWRLIRLPTVSQAPSSQITLAKGTLSGPFIKPGKSGRLDLNLPKNWAQADVLEVTAYDPHEMEVMRWSLPISKQLGKHLEPKLLGGSTVGTVERVNNNPYILKVGEQTWAFSNKTGMLVSNALHGKPTGLGNGPYLYGATVDEKLDFSARWNVKAYQEGAKHFIRSSNELGDSFLWAVSPDGSVMLDYHYAPRQHQFKYLSVGFDLEESNVAAKSWRGNGPYRVWANRLKGGNYGVWSNIYNDKQTGLSQWGVPEFKGIFSQVDWLKLDLKTNTSLVLNTQPGSFVGVLRPSNTIATVPVHPKKLQRGGAAPLHAVWNYPDAGGLHFFHKIPGIGTKFSYAQDLGPQGQATSIEQPIVGRILIQLKELDK